MRPDRKGIKTLYLPLFVTQIKVEMRPDRKGIKTFHDPVPNPNRHG